MKIHLQINQAQLQGAQHAILSGDPGRVPILAKALDPNAYEIGNHRGYLSYLATYKKLKVLVSTSGIGGASTSIIVEELAQCGIKNIIRVGTTGTLQPHIQLWDVIIANAAVRYEGVSEDFAPIEFPAVSDFYTTERLMNAARKVDRGIHVGTIATTKTFYPGQERYDTHTGFVLPSLEKRVALLQKLNILSFEMEAATLFTACQAMGLTAGCYLVVVANRTQSEQVTHGGITSQKGHFAEEILLGYYDQIIATL